MHERRLDELGLDELVVDLGRSVARRPTTSSYVMPEPVEIARASLDRHRRMHVDARRARAISSTIVTRRHGGGEVDRAGRRRSITVVPLAAQRGAATSVSVSSIMSW